MDLEKEFGFTKETVKMKPDYEGEVIITIFKRNASTGSKKALLYLHGFNDYFFQTHLADKINEAGFNFYALELRKYGRSILPHQSPNFFKNHNEYFEDIDKAVEIVKERDGNKMLVLMGHSTGGLLFSLYAHHKNDKNIIDALVLNSPFFEFNEPGILLKSFVPLMTSIGKRFPYLPSPKGLDKGYGYSLHKKYHGEWDYDLKLKPIEGFKIYAGWIGGIHTAQKELQKGLDIKCPVLVMVSGKSVKPGNYRPEMQSADSVLNVKHIKKYAKGLGEKTDILEFDGGLHDLVLSKKEVREKVLNKMASFISSL